MLLVDARRLTGPNLLARTPLVIAEIDLGPGEALDAALAAYVGELARMRSALGFSPKVTPVVRIHEGGAVFGYAAPIDVMLACAEMSEWAGMSASRILAREPALPIEPKKAEIAAILAKDRSPDLLAIAAEAARRSLPFTWDDALVTVGAGRGSFTFPRHEVPEPAAVPWSTLGTIPIALVTGTNGKTTSARLLARVAREAGHSVGCTSTGGVAVNGVIVEEGDWTGPAAARMVLRRHDVDFAVLETARGGILRRGLAVDRCDASLITNVSDDHLGLYGIDHLAAMTQVKGLIAQIVPKSGTVVLNARDPHLVAFAPNVVAHVTYFCAMEGADAAARAVVAAARARGDEVVLAEGDDILIARGDHVTHLVRASDVPLTFGGVARYNVENVLGVVAMARALGLPDSAIARALTSFGAKDNPGRGELIDKEGVRVFLDFGHNPEAVRAALHLAAALRAKSGGRLFVITGSAGDRSNREIEDIARAVVEARPERVLVRELTGYLRGRREGEVPALFEGFFRALGLPHSALRIAPTEVLALRDALADARPGDVIALLVHLDHDEVQALLRPSP